MSAGDWKDMFLAACDGDVELVRYHLDRGVDVDFVHAEFQSTVLVAAILVRQDEVADLLLDRGADPTLASDMEECTPIEAARRSGLDDVVLRLRSLGAQEPPPPAKPRGPVVRWLSRISGR